MTAPSRLAPAAPPSPAPKPARAAAILVADDERSLRELLAIVLRREGYDVLLAENGKMALAALDRGSVDLLISDIKMPDMSGHRGAAQRQADRPGAAGHHDDGVCQHRRRPSRPCGWAPATTWSSRSTSTSSS